MIFLASPGATHLWYGPKSDCLYKMSFIKAYLVTRAFVFTTAFEGDSIVPRALQHNGFNKKKKKLVSHPLDQLSSSKGIKNQEFKLLIPLKIYLGRWFAASLEMNHVLGSYLTVSTRRRDLRTSKETELKASSLLDKVGLNEGGRRLQISLLLGCSSQE